MDKDVFRILKFLNKYLSNELASLFILSLLSEIFPNISKASKIIPTHNKDSDYYVQTINQFVFYYKLIKLMKESCKNHVNHLCISPSSRSR